ncbi:MAG: SDR family NAD(P)-dependent oxidoreductase [Pseudomonadota bacterium]
MDVAGSVAVISGGASGLGAATAKRLAAEGAKVALLDVNTEAGEALAQDLGGAFFTCDVTQATAVAGALAGVEAQLGLPRILVACAGIAPGAKTVGRDGASHDAALFQKVMDINVMGSFHLASQGAAMMARTSPEGPDGARGVIVLTASIAAYEAQIGQIAYGASKGAVAAMALPMARDLAPLGIRVMALAPGLFKTPMVAGLPLEVQEALGAAVPYPSRLGDPAEFAGLVAHIVENGMLNGAVLRLDGAIRLPPK